VERTVNISLSEFARLLSRVAVTEAPAALHRGVVSGAMRSIPVLQRRTREASPANPSGLGTGGAFNYGDYLRAWKSVPISNGARVFNDRPYAAIIELGRRAGARQPPPDAMAHWAQRRLGVSKKEAKRLAFQVGRAISRRGLAPRLVLSSALPEIMDVVREEIVRELEAVL
jgi:hypothetical protein